MIFAIENTSPIQFRGFFLSRPSIIKFLQKCDSNSSDYSKGLPSSFITYLQERTPVADEIVKRHRENFNYFKKKFNGLPNFHLLKSELRDKECPFIFPILAPNEKKRNNIASKCLKKGIGIRVYWQYLPKLITRTSEYVISHRLSERILCLPIHYGLSEKDLELTFRCFKDL